MYVVGGHKMVGVRGHYVFWYGVNICYICYMVGVRVIMWLRPGVTICLRSGVTILLGSRATICLGSSGLGSLCIWGRGSL